MIWRFAQPLPAIAAILVIGWWFYRQRKAGQPEPAMTFSDTRLFAGLPSNWKVRFHALPEFLRWLALGCSLIALARPQTGQNQQIIHGQGVEIVLALDISSSMAETDFVPQNRLEAAKSVVNDFIGQREFDRIGLVVFAHDAYQLVPPTLDYEVLRNTVSNLQLASLQGMSDGTAIGMGIASAGNMLRESSVASKVIILLTDGANNAGDIGPVTASQSVAALGIRVYTVGMIRPQSALVSPVQQSDLDEATLQRVASITSGQYFSASSETDLAQIYQRINQLERSDIEKQIYVRWEDQFYWFVIGSLLLEIIGQFLLHTAFQVIP